jgi:hypothetical protein
MPTDARGLLLGTTLRIPEINGGILLKPAKNQKQNTPLA